MINYELPDAAENYVHRIGRTGRAGLTGEAISLVAPDEREQLAAIEKLLKMKLQVVPCPNSNRSGGRAAIREGGPNPAPNGATKAAQRLAEVRGPAQPLSELQGLWLFRIRSSPNPICLPTDRQNAQA